MRDWIIGLQKSASQRNDGVNPHEWLAIETEAGLPVPAELRELYEAMDGARLAPDVRLITFRGGDEGPGVIDQSRAHVAGLPQRGVWLFGVKGQGQQLFAARRRELANSPEPKPDWLPSVGDDEFVYGIRKTTDDIKHYRSLEQLLTRLVPPAQTEDFGDITYARALTAVQGALDQLEDAKGDSLEADPDIGKTTRVAVPVRAVKRAAKKAKRAPPKKKKSIAAKKKVGRKSPSKTRPRKAAKAAKAAKTRKRKSKR
jgi:hypothetical protein